MIKHLSFRARTTLMLCALATVLVACGGKEPIEVTTTSDGFKQVKVIGSTMQWKIEGATLEVKVTAPARGWVGVGFDPDSIMKGANFIIGYVESNVGRIEDHYGDKLTEHSSDVELGGTENTTLISATEGASSTTLHFSIPLDSGDEYDKPLVPGQTYKILLAYHDSDDFVSEHSADARIGFDVEL